MAKTVVALFDDVLDAHRAVDSLLANGYRRGSVQLKEDASLAAARATRPARRREAKPLVVAIGTLTGGFWGTLAGGVTGIYMVAEPGVGGLGSLIAATAIGAIAGAGVGTALGMFFGSGAVPESTTEQAASARPGAVVTVETFEGQAEATAQFLTHSGAEDVSIQTGPRGRAGDDAAV